MKIIIKVIIKIRIIIVYQIFSTNMYSEFAINYYIIDVLTENCRMIIYKILQNLNVVPRPHIWNIVLRLIKIKLYLL